MKLLSLGPSHYCEKARWALQRAKLPFDEVFYPPLIHVPYLRRAGGRTAPVLETDSGPVTDSTDILRFVADHPDSQFAPYPVDVGEEALALEEDFDRRLGPSVRRFAYVQMLPHRELILPSLTAGASPAHTRLTRLGFRPLRALMRRSMNLTPEGAERSRKKLVAVFDEVGERLSDGRRYLLGDTFTAADITLAALAAPLCEVEGYGAPLPSFADLPDAAQQALAPLRDHVTGEYVRRLYREER